MNKAALIEEFNFKEMAPKIAAIEMMTVPGVECDILPIIDTAAKTISSATHVSHHKFSISVMKDAWPKMTEPVTLAMTLECLKHCYNIPAEMFNGRMTRFKMGGYSIENEYQTAVRMWGTKRVGSRLIVEVSVLGYKGSVPRPNKEFAGKAILLPD